MSFPLSTEEVLCLQACPSGTETKWLIAFNSLMKYYFLLYKHESVMMCSYLYATKYFQCWNLFNTLHTVRFMHGLSIYEMKIICHCVYFFIISYGSFQHLTKFLNRWKSNTSPEYRAKTVVIFSQLLSFTLSFAHGFKLVRNCASLFVLPSCDRIPNDIFWQLHVVEN